MMNGEIPIEHEDVEPQKLEIPIPPDGDFGGEDSLQENELSQWINFMDSPLFRTVIYTHIERERVINEAIERGYISGPLIKKSTSEYDDALTVYDLIHKGQLTPDYLSKTENARIKRWITHYCNDIKAKVESDYFKNLSHLLISREDFVTNMVQSSLSKDAHHHAIVRPALYPDDMRPQDEQELYNKLCSLIRTDIETI